jgi:5'-nucleotidase
VRILLTNDDGITSDGLWAAARGLARVGHLTVIGTVDDWSSGSASTRMTVGARLARFDAVPDDLGPNVEAYSIEASPGGAILVGLMGDLFEPFDLVASGANYGVNVGGDLVYSGTLGAAATGFQRGVTAFGVSAARSGQGEPQRWDQIADVSERIAAWMLGRTGPPILLNVNVPHRAFAELEGARLVPPGRWANLDRGRFTADPEADGSWRIAMSVDPSVTFPDGLDTDAGAVRAGWIAVSQVVPTGFTLQPAHDLGGLVDALAPGSPAPSIIQAPETSGDSRRGTGR